MRRDEHQDSIGRANVRDSHATLILVEKLPLEGGTKLTRDFAASIGRSHHVIDMSAANAKEDALAWLRQFAGMSSVLVLNVAGLREPKSPGIQAKTTVRMKQDDCQNYNSLIYFWHDEL